MGTNYYWRYNICDKCNRYDELHIGKSSFGWAFSLHVYPEQKWADDDYIVIENLEDWKEKFTTEGSKIFDEYNREVSKDEVLDTITNRI